MWSLATAAAAAVAELTSRGPATFTFKPLLPSLTAHAKVAPDLGDSSGVASSTITLKPGVRDGLLFKFGTGLQLLLVQRLSFQIQAKTDDAKLASSLPRRAKVATDRGNC